MPQYELAQAGTEQKDEGSADCFREQVFALLPRLSAFAHCLTGNAEQRDDLVQETSARALAAHKDQWPPGTHFDSWMFRIAQNLWFDRKRAKKIRGHPVDFEVTDFLVGSDGWAVAESELVFADLLKALDHLSPDHRVLIALVCVVGLTYTEAADILSLPVGTAISRLARGRLVLHDAVRAASASKATRH
jgi:RNA polymerase sigma-70 factor (ECF subfamily)